MIPLDKRRVYNYKYKGFNIKTGKVFQEELRTVGLYYVYPGDITENDIRKEQKIDIRLSYGNNNM